MAEILVPKNMYVPFQKKITKILALENSVAFFFLSAIYMKHVKKGLGMRLLYATLYIVQVVAFCDVDVKKIEKGVYTYQESEVTQCYIQYYIALM